MLHHGISDNKLNRTVRPDNALKWESANVIFFKRHDLSIKYSESLIQGRMFINSSSFPPLDLTKTSQFITLGIFKVNSPFQGVALVLYFQKDAMSLHSTFSVFCLVTSLL